MKIQIPLSRVWIALPIIASFLVAFVQRVRPHDYWWHLAMGRRFSETGEIPSSNIFLYTRPVDEAFFNQPWLGQWLMFKMHELGGPIVGVVFLAFSCLVFTLMILWTLKNEKVNPQFAGLLALFALAAAKPVFSVRTRMFAIVPVVVVSALLFRFRSGKGTIRSLYWIPPITVFWANTHGSFVVAVALCWILVGDFAWRLLFEKGSVEFKTIVHTSSVALLTTIAGAVHPYGLKVYTYVFHLAVQSDVGATVSEWQPLSIQKPIGIFVFFLFLVAFFLLIRARKKLSLFSTLAFALAVYLGFSAERSLLFFASIVPFVLAPFLPMGSEEEEPKPIESVVNGLILLGFIISVFLSFPPLRPLEITKLMPPTRSAEPGAGILSNENIAPSSVDGARRIFHEQGIGGQLEWILDGQVSFVDQRMEYIPQSVWDEYDLVSAGKVGWDKILRKYDVDTIVVHRELQRGLFVRLKNSKEFYKKAVDGPYTIFLFDGFQNPLKENSGNGNKDNVDSE